MAKFENRMRWGVASLLGLMLSTGMIQIQAKPIEVGQPFPVLSLPSLQDGRAMNVLDFRARPLLLHLFASW